MRAAVEDIGKRWMAAIAHPIPPIKTNAARCQEVVITADDLRKPDGGLKLLPVPVSTPGFDSAPYLSATASGPRGTYPGPRCRRMRGSGPG